MLIAMCLLLLLLLPFLFKKNRKYSFLTFIQSDNLTDYKMQLTTITIENISRRRNERDAMQNSVYTTNLFRWMNGHDKNKTKKENRKKNTQRTTITTEKNWNECDWVCGKCVFFFLSCYTDDNTVCCSLKI